MRQPDTATPSKVVIVVVGMVVGNRNRSQRRGRGKIDTAANNISGVAADRAVRNGHRPGVKNTGARLGGIAANRAAGDIQGHARIGKYAAALAADATGRVAAQRAARHSYRATLRIQSAAFANGNVPRYHARAYVELRAVIEDAASKILNPDPIGVAVCNRQA